MSVQKIGVGTDERTGIVYICGEVIRRARRWFHGSGQKGVSGMRPTTILLTAALVGMAAHPVQASSLTTAFEAACDRTPEIQMLSARRAEIEARTNAAGALLPGGPWATVTHRTDAITNDRGTREYNAEFTVPVWLRGERGASLAAALTGRERLEAEIAAKRLDVAKRIRDAFWMVAEARDKVAIAERRFATATTLVQALRRQGQSGQSELMDVKLASADARDAEAALAGRRAELQQAAIAFQVLTGGPPPAAFREREVGKAVPTDHPRVVLRRRAAEKAVADQELVFTQDRERPEFGGFVSNARDTSAEPNITSLGVRLKVPFAYDAINQPKRAAAAAEVVGAREEAALAEREVAGDAAQAQARLVGARQQRAALDARHGDLASVVQLTEQGQRSGQAVLTDLIRARLQLYEADLSRAVARIAVERARSDLNQALGLEP